MMKFVIIPIIILLALACRKPYAPVVISGQNSYLVVEGVINSGSDSTYFRLSRTIKLSAKDTVKAENNATVSVEGDDNTAYPLSEISSGIYAAPPMGLTSSAKYRLRIKTAGNEEYLSDYVPTKVTPQVDSVSYTVENDGVQFYVSTHDPNNAARYYRWDFEETFGYLSLAQSFYKIGADGLPEYRTEQQDKFYECFKTVPSKQILLASTTHLSQDLLIKQPSDFITAESGKISHGYSLLVHEYALTEEGYTYWQQIKKNTEQIGSIFDAQPSEVKGNVICISNPAQPVIGFVSASNVTAKRVFVDAQNTVVVTPGYLPPPTYDECYFNYDGVISVNPEESFKTRLQHLTYTGDTLLTVAFVDKFTHKITGYGYLPRVCTDCRVKSPFGTNAIPVFWPMNEHY